MSLRTGLRIGDVLSIRWNHLEDVAYDFTQGKIDKPLWIPLTHRLNSHLATFEKKGLTVVTVGKGRPVTHRTVAEEMRNVKATMKHPKASSFATHWLRKNATIAHYLAECDDDLVKP